MKEVGEFHFERGGSLQVFEDSQRAGASFVTLAVTDLDEQLDDLKKKGIPTDQVNRTDQVSTAMIQDPLESNWRRDRPPPRQPRPRQKGHPQPVDRRSRRGRGGLHRPRGARPGDDPDVRRPQHLYFDLTFMMHELARHPEVLARLCEEQDRVLGGAIPSVDQLERELPYLDMVLDEVLRPLSTRLDRPAARRPRLRVRRLLSAQKGAYVDYYSWASHRIPEVFPDPEAFIPERFTRERKAALPRGAYVPFGGGSPHLHRQALRPDRGEAGRDDAPPAPPPRRMPGRTMTIRQMPTLSPKGGLKMRAGERGLPAGLPVAFLAFAKGVIKE